MVEDYGPDLDELNEGDRVGVMRTSEVCPYSRKTNAFCLLHFYQMICSQGDLVLYVNSFAQGVAVTGIPDSVWACVDLYGKCVQVSVNVMNRNDSSISRPLSTFSIRISSLEFVSINNYFLCIALSTAITSAPSVFDSNQDEEDNQTALLATGGGGSCVSTPGSISSSASVSLGGVMDRLRFHHRCGTMVKLSAGQRTGERRRPLDEFNNGVVMTQRPLMPDELFEIRIDSLVDKWSGSIEVGITTHNPQALDFPSTMTNLRSGTVGYFLF